MMHMVNYTNNYAKYGRAGLIYSNNEYLNISISKANFDQNFILNYRNQPDVHLKAGHFYIEKANRFEISYCTFMPYNTSNAVLLTN